MKKWTLLGVKEGSLNCKNPKYLDYVLNIPAIVKDIKIQARQDHLSNTFTMYKSFQCPHRHGKEFFAKKACVIEHIRSMHSRKRLEDLIYKDLQNEIISDIESYLNSNIDKEIYSSYQKYLK